MLATSTSLLGSRATGTVDIVGVSQAARFNDHSHTATPLFSLFEIPPSLEMLLTHWG